MKKESLCGQFTNGQDIQEGGAGSVPSNSRAAECRLSHMVTYANPAQKKQEAI